MEECMSHKGRPNRGIADRETLSRLESGRVQDYESALRKLVLAYYGAGQKGLNPSNIRKKYDFLVGKMEKYLDAEAVSILREKYPLDGGLEKE
jgi:hypothetical protein